MALLLLLVMWLAFAGLGAWIAGQKHRSVEEGFALGLIFGPLGCLIEALLPMLERPDDSALVKSEVSTFDRTGGAVHSREQREVQPSERNRAFWAQAQEEDRVRLREAQREAEARQHYKERRGERIQRRQERILRTREFWTRFEGFYIRFGWFRALPEALQPIVVAIVIAMRQ